MLLSQKRKEKKSISKMLRVIVGVLETGLYLNVSFVIVLLLFF